VAYCFGEKFALQCGMFSFLHGMLSEEHEGKIASDSLSLSVVLIFSSVS
jgi:hypothetical protein